MSIWGRAMEMADQTPVERNRYVDFLRAFSIACVVLGHWLVAAPYVEEGQLTGAHLLGVLDWSQWLTWLFQVMPIFFLVGGYSNGVSWSLTLAREGAYATWLVGRLQRLINPVMPLFLLWAVFAGFANLAGVSVEMVSLVTQLALVPVWFLAVYLIVVAFVPLTWRLWQSLGMGSILLLMGLAIIVDVLEFQVGIKHISYLNFAFVWLAVHQLGYAWQAGRLSGASAIVVGVLGLIALLALTVFGPYPIAMIGVPGAEISNSMPPTIALLALGLTQTGLLLSLEIPFRAWLSKTSRWAAVILVNGMIMSVYLWHLTAFIIATALGYAFGLGLELEPGSPVWWWARLIWVPLFVLFLVPLALLFARFEQGGMPIPDALPAWRLVAAVILVCGGLALTAAGGIGSAGWTGIKLWVVALPFIGAGLVNFGPLAGRFTR